MIEVRLVLEPGTDRAAIEKTIRDNLARRIATVGGRPVEICYGDKQPERNLQSRKLIRVVRRF